MSNTARPSFRSDSCSIGSSCLDDSVKVCIMTSGVVEIPSAMDPGTSSIEVDVRASPLSQEIGKDGK